LDELDKISRTHKGDEIVNQLIHLIDPSQNQHYQDRYFGNIDIDLSRVTWIFSYNDADLINPILKDRIMQVNTSGFTLPDKVAIAQKFLIPSICKEVGIDVKRIVLSDTIVRALVTDYTAESGVRKLKERLYDILRDINLDDLRGNVNLPNKRRRSSRQHPAVFEITMDAVRDRHLKDLTPILREKTHQMPSIGRVNGLYACANELGGITPFETHWIPSETCFGLSLTGNLGKVMCESAQVAKTLAWRLLTQKQRALWTKQWQKSKASIHLHCPDGAIPKDGPSAGTALTVALLSLLTHNKVSNAIAITGEMNLSGDVLAIGGLQSKLYGAKMAGCSKAFYPQQNHDTVVKLCAAYPDLCDETFEVAPISTIFEVVEEVFLTKANIDMETAFHEIGGESATPHVHSSAALRTTVRHEPRLCQRVCGKRKQT
jgi:ATP-dependent Lon protease